MKSLRNHLFLLAVLVASQLVFTGCEKDAVVIDPEINEDSTSVDTPKPPTTTAKANYYVSLTGNDANPGTFDKPFKTIEKAFSKAGKTDLIYVRGGVYPLKDINQQFGLKFENKNGQDSLNKIKVWAYPGERVVLDCKAMTKKDDSVFGLWIVSSNMHIKGFEIVNLPQNINPNTGSGNYNVGILISGTNVVLEDCSAHDCQGTGINLGASSSGTFVLNCDAYNNYDPYTYSDGKPYAGGNADGFHITVNGLNSNQKFKGCRSWNNSDDGYDCYNTEGYVDFDSCWAFQNGYLPNSKTASTGDGSGFKLGATSGQYTTVKKNVRNCVSAINRSEGFTQNNGKVVMHIYNNTSYKNGGLQFDFGNKFSGQSSIELKNNIAIGASIVYAPYAVQEHNTWDSSVKATDEDFLTVDTSLLSVKRQNNGVLPNNTLFRLASNSDLNNAAVNLGFGKNMGAF